MNKYIKEIHKIGRIGLALGLCMMLVVPFVISANNNIFPPLPNFIKGFLQVAMIYIPIATAEFLTFVPILGTGASYLAFITGNLTNLKIPCASMALENANVKSGTKEAEVIATIAVAVSSMVTIIIIFIGIILIKPIEPFLSSETLAPAFDNILPALFGALGAYWFVKHPKLAVVPISLMIVVAIILKFLGVDIYEIQGALIPVLGGIALLSTYIMYKKGLFKGEEK